MATIERIDGRNSIPPLKDAPPRPPNAAAAGNQNNGDQHGALEGIGESENT